MKALLCLSLFLIAALAIRLPNRRRGEPVITPAFVEEVNKHAKTWTAGMNENSVVAGVTYDEARGLCGTLLGGPKLPAKTDAFDSTLAIPEEFSSITAWPKCPTMSMIRDQSACGSCWAFGAVEAMSDRVCVATKKTVVLSSADMAFCCDSCGYGCQGGYPSAAWEYWVSTGVTEENCYPYPFPSCDHHIPGSKNPCPTNLYPTPNCPNACTNSSWEGPSWNKDKHFGSSAYSLDSVKQIQTDMMQSGPVEGAFSVYADFLTYKSGVYQHTSGEYLGGHAIKILGWGVENGTPYWLCANSWNVHWGDKGFFKILRGADECGIEDGVVAGHV